MKTNNNAKKLTEIGSHNRQGDTLLIRRESLPKNQKRVKSKTLAFGEKTNHHHTFRDNNAVGFADDAEAQLADFIKIDEEATLTHEEHTAIKYPAGIWESIKQVEDTAQEVRRVAD